MFWFREWIQSRVDYYIDVLHVLIIMKVANLWLSDVKVEFSYYVITKFFQQGCQMSDDHTDLFIYEWLLLHLWFCASLVVTKVHNLEIVLSSHMAWVDYTIMVTLGVTA